MPDPSKESLERATPKEFVLLTWPNATAFFVNMYWPGQGERKKWIVLRSSSESMSQVQADSEEDAWKLAAYKITAKDLRQRNAALVEALRLAEKYLPIGGEACLYCDNDGEEHDYRCFVTKIRAALAPYAPADALEKEPRRG